MSPSEEARIAGAEAQRWIRRSVEALWPSRLPVAQPDLEQAEVTVGGAAGRRRTRVDRAARSSDATRFLMLKENCAESGPAHFNVVLNWFEEVKGRMVRAK